MVVLLLLSLLTFLIFLPRYKKHIALSNKTRISECMFNSLPSSIFKKRQTVKRMTLILVSAVVLWSFVWLYITGLSRMSGIPQENVKNMHIGRIMSDLPVNMSKDAKG